jgi:uncharacterized HAD superfamily protein
MKIGIDIDEVVVEFVRGYIKILARKGIAAEYEKTHSYNFWESYPITRDEAIKFADELFESEYFDTLELVSGAKEAINKLEKNNELFFITSRPNYIKIKTQKFIEEHFPNSNISLIFSGDFHKSNGKTKAEICKDLGIKILIEDNKKYALECANNGIKTFLINKPWNKNPGFHENLIKVNSWPEILRHLNF